MFLNNVINIFVCNENADGTTDYISCCVYVFNISFNSLAVLLRQLSTTGHNLYACIYLYIYTLYYFILKLCLIWYRIL